MSDVQVALESGKYDDGDRALVAFALAFPETAEASESIFWRALLRMDPSNPDASPRLAIEMFGRYLVTPAPRAHDSDARMLRRIATILESQKRAVAGRTELEARSKERDEELQRTKDELTKTLAELDRIKRRLSSPKP